ncbi:hypothetical protein DEA98_19270 [Brucella pseudogrignonensis]|nr:hypothetical protein [Brucella pseudogrignonensis]
MTLKLVWPHWYVRFTPTSVVQINQAECWFAALRRKQLQRRLHLFVAMEFHEEDDTIHLFDGDLRRRWRSLSFLWNQPRSIGLGSYDQMLDRDGLRHTISSNLCAGSLTIRYGCLDVGRLMKRKNLLSRDAVACYPFLNNVFTSLAVISKRPLPNNPKHLM